MEDVTKCFVCKGPFHPASGHMFAPDICYCGRCYRAFLPFFKGRIATRKSGPDFAKEAATSIKVKSDNPK